MKSMEFKIDDGKVTYFDVTQNEQMEVTAFRKDDKDGRRISEGIFLGKYRNIEDEYVGGQIDSVLLSIIKPSV